MLHCNVLTIPPGPQEEDDEPAKKKAKTAPVKGPPRVNNGFLRQMAAVEKSFVRLGSSI